MQIKHKIKAFTLIELLVTMALTGILVVFAYMGYFQTQKLFENYTIQSKFINDYNQLNKALFLISNKAQTIEKAGEHSIDFITDSNRITLDVTEKTLLLKFKSHTDTFEMSSKNMKYIFLKMGNNITTNFIKNFECNVFFINQKFRVSFHKDYDATSILNATIIILPPNEQY